MAKTPTLTENQIKAAANLASGMTQDDTAKLSSVTRITINRWLKNKTFSDEVNRRREQVAHLHEQEATKLQAFEIKNYYAQLKELRLAALEAAKEDLELSARIKSKMLRRFEDLPEEAYAPKDIASMLTLANAFSNNGLKEWGEAIGVEKLLKQLDETS